MGEPDRQTRPKLKSNALLGVVPDSIPAGRQASHLSSARARARLLSASDRGGGARVGSSSRDGLREASCEARGEEEREEEAARA